MNNKKIITFISIIIGLSLILFLLKLIPEKKEINNTTKLLDEKRFYQIQDAISNHINNKDLSLIHI